MATPDPVLRAAIGAWLRERLISDEYGVAPEHFTTGSELLEDLELSSLDVLALELDACQHYRVEVPQGAFLGRDVAAIAELLEERVQAARSA